MPLWLKLSSSAIDRLLNCWLGCGNCLISLITLALDHLVGVHQHVSFGTERNGIQAQRAHVGPAPQRVAGAVVRHAMERTPEAIVLLLVHDLAIHMRAPAR